MVATIEKPRTSSTSEVDEALQVLKANKKGWATLPIRKKHDLLKTMRADLKQHMERWVALSVEAKQLDPQSPWVGEIWAGGPWAIAMGITSLLRSTEALAQGDVPKPMKLCTGPGGRLIGQVYPVDIYDRLLINGLKMEIWMQPGVTRDNLADYTASFYKQEDPPGQLALVLGAGNLNAIPVLDALHQLYVLGRVVLLKLSPVNDYLSPVIKDIFQAYIQAGYLRIVSGGARFGSMLVRRPEVDVVHMTGSIDTFETIVFGEGEEGQERKGRNERIIEKPVTCELGGAGPIIVVPGPWDEADLQYQAERILTIKLHNSGYNCVSGQVLLLPESWEKSQELVELIRNIMKALPHRKAFYPGTTERIQEFLAHYPSAEQYGNPDPRVLLTGLEPDCPDSYVFREEIFAPVLAQVNLAGSSPAEFIKNAIHFSNHKLQGSLGANILIHPKTMKELGPDLDEYISQLRYGSIGINIWSAAGFLLPQAVWGGYPGATATDIQSGTGFVHNSLMFDKAEKTVSRGSFYPFPRAWLQGEFHISPKPAWFVTNKTADKTLRQVAHMAADPSLKYLPGIFASALRG